MIRQHVNQAKTRQPADRNVDLRLAHQPTVMDHAEQKTGQHKPQCHLGIDARPSGTMRRVTRPHLRPKPTQIEHLVYSGEHMAVGNEITKRARDQQFRLAPRLTSQHRAHRQIVAGNSESGGPVATEPKLHFSSRCRCFEGHATV
jgi:hypothetical protein